VSSAGFTRRSGSPFARLAVAICCACVLLAPASPLSASDPVVAAPEIPALRSESRALGAPSRSVAAPGDQPGRESSGSLVQTIVALGGVLALALVGGAVVRGIARSQGGLRLSLSAGGRAPSGILEVLGRYPIARGSCLVLLKIDRRILLLSQTAHGRLGTGASFTTLCEITDPDEIASILVKARDAEGDSMAERFRGILSRFDRSYEEPFDPGVSRRRTSRGPDHVELWDEARTEIPLVDLTRQPGPPEQGPIASLRKRLATLRTEGGKR
jgi:hypothetical protein